ncbi:MAG: hydrogenase maturation nickel metallochaperone HypA [Gemmatimonadaceae bacterium]
MHELSIAMSLVDAACEESEDLEEGSRIIALHLRLGALAGVVKEALLFSFDLVAADTVIAGARLLIEDVPVVVMCPTCNEEREIESIQRFRCPICGAPAPNVIRGRELQLFAMEIDDCVHTHS